MAASKIVYSKTDLIFIKYKIEKSAKNANLSDFSELYTKSKERKTHRGCRSGKSFKHRKTNNKWNLLLWNIEGYKNIIKEVPENNLFQNYELIFLNETFLCEQMKIPEYITYTVEAVKPNTRGRPSGGILASFKSKLQPKLIDKNQHYIIVKTNIAHFINFYFPPTMDFADISDMIDTALNKIDKNHNNTIYLLGDFNCRTDNNSEKGVNLIEHLSNEQFKLLNDTRFTYIAPNGSSTIDLIFTNAPRFTTKVKIIPTIERKHQRIQIGIYATQPTPMQLKKRSSRKLNEELLIENCSILQTNTKAFYANLNALNREITTVLKSSRTTPKYHSHKIWFDKECKELKQKCISKQTNKDDNYKNLRREYKSLIKNKRTTYEENKLIENFGKNEVQWHLFRPKRSLKPSNISTTTLHTHYKSLYSYQPLTLQSNSINYEKWCDELFREDEIYKAIMQSKNNKATGTDEISYELLKQSLPHMETEWLMMFNRCLIEAEIPEKWRESKIWTLYKGKGEVDDPNNYRGIALQQTMFKCLTKLINDRIITNVLHILPKEQYGFLPQKSTLQAIQNIIYDIHTALQKTRGCLYACFVDFEKAFDNVDRNLLNEKLRKDFNIGGKLLSLLNTIMEENWIHVYNDEEKSERIIQRKGLAQGDSLSPTLFIMYLFDLPKKIIENNNDLKIVMYADDLLFYSKNALDIKIALENLSNYCHKNKLTINLKKTQIIKFRKGGRLAKSDVFKYRDEIVNITNKYNYLGVTLQSKLSFTEHFRHRKLQAIKAINCLNNLTRLSIETAEQLFEIKILPIITYGISAFYKHVTLAQLNEIDKVKFTFIKRTLGVSKTASNTACVNMLGWRTLGDDLIHKYKIPESVTSEYKKYREDKNWKFVEQNFTDGPAFRGSCWKKANQRNRSFICRVTMHGLHHLICTNDKPFHDLNINCKCKYCNNMCNNRYHVLECNKVPKSLLT